MEGILSLEFKDGSHKYLDHNFFASTEKAEKTKIMKPIRQEYKEKRLKIYCCCKTEKVEMSVAFYEKSCTYSIKSFPGKSIEHASNCFFAADDNSALGTDTISEKGLIENNGKVDVRLDVHDFKKTIEPSNKFNRKDRINSKDTSGRTRISRNKSTVYALTKRLLTEAWNKSIMKVRFPEDHKKSSSEKEVNPSQYPTIDKTTVFYCLRNDILWKYSIGKDSLKNLFYSGGKTGQIFHIEAKSLSKSAAFTILLLEDANIVRKDERVVLSLRAPSSDVRECFVPSHLYDNALGAINNISGPYFVGGFITKMPYTESLEFLSFCLVPISDYGTPIESSYERNLFNALALDKRLVTRPMSHKSNPKWNGFVPDGLLYDTQPKTILEVFGMSQGHVEYQEKRKIKIEHFESLQPHFNLWYWDANDGSIPPALPTPNN